MRLPGLGLLGRGAGVIRDLAVDAAATVLEPPLSRALDRRERAADLRAARDGPHASQAAVEKARELGVMLDDVEGTGSDGMVTARDVLASGRPAG